MLPASVASCKPTRARRTTRCLRCSGTTYAKFEVNYRICVPLGMHTISILTVILFLKSLDYKHLPHAQRVYHDFLSLLRSLFSSRACLSCHTFFPGTIEEKSRKKEESICFFQRFGRLSFAFFHRLVEIYFALSVIFLFFLLSSFVSCACM